MSNTDFAFTMVDQKKVIQSDASNSPYSTWSHIGQNHLSALNDSERLEAIPRREPDNMRIENSILAQSRMAQMMQVIIIVALL